MSIDTGSSNEVVLRVENLGKTFKFYPSQTGRIKEWLAFGKRSYHQNFQALTDVSFEVRRGEFLGVIGPNGAGKSTLLKIITGVLEQTGGSYSTRGKVLSLLELSGGMDDDLTGRENVIRSAQLLGFPDNYARDRMDEIAEFAELGDFFDRPLISYSSGMRIRLAFSLFAFMDCDILILDEVLAVGDIFFKQKCYARLEELIARETAVILVTHSTGVVRRYCKEVIVLNKGSIFFRGDADEAIQRYYLLQRNPRISSNPQASYIEEELEDIVQRSKASTEVIDWPVQVSPDVISLPPNCSSKYAALTQLTICNSQGKARQAFSQAETAYFYVEYLIKENMGVPVAGIALNTVHNLLIHGKNSLNHNLEVPMKVQAGSRLRFRQAIRLDLAPGNYIFNLNLWALHPDDYLHLEALSPAELKEHLILLLRVRPAGTIEVTPHRIGGRFAQLHTGMCDLAGEVQLQVIHGAD